MSLARRGGNAESEAEEAEEAARREVAANVDLTLVNQIQMHLEGLLVTSTNEQYPPRS